MCVSVESTALRLITALGSSEVQPQFTRFLSDPKTVLSAESEELNRALILTLARATHITGTPHTPPSPFTTLFDSMLKVTFHQESTFLNSPADLSIMGFTVQGFLFCVVALDFFTGSDSIQGTWCKEILQTIMNFTPHNWASHTLSCFPAPLQVSLHSAVRACCYVN